MWHVFRHPFFWLGFFAMSFALSAVGVGAAWLIVPIPPVYHRTTYFEFPMPPDWSCDRDGTETTCFPKGPPPHAAIIVLAAKWRGPADTRDAYIEHLGNAHPWVNGKGETVTPEVIYVRETVLAGHTWVDAMHRNSEVERFLTRYLASVTTDIGVLLTYSIAETRRDDFEPALDAAVEQLDIYQAPAALPPS